MVRIYDAIYALVFAEDPPPEGGGLMVRIYEAIYGLVFADPAHELRGPYRLDECEIIDAGQEDVWSAWQDLGGEA
jgi:hypothetical protein